MREIKFRAWDKKNKRMLLLELNGFLTDIEDARYTLLEVVFSSRHVAYVDDYYHNTNQEQFSLMQNTGSKDKNGVEIYEGDIVKHDLWGNHEVIWEMAGFRMTNNSLENDVNMGHSQLKRCRVIGNIYENPELLNNQSGVLDE